MGTLLGWRRIQNWSMEWWRRLTARQNNDEDDPCHSLVDWRCEQIDCLFLVSSPYLFVFQFKLMIGLDFTIGQMEQEQFEGRPWTKWKTEALMTRKTFHSSSHPRFRRRFKVSLTHMPWIAYPNFSIWSIFPFHLRLYEVFNTDIRISHG